MTTRKKAKEEKKVVVTLVKRPSTEKLRQITFSMGLRKMNDKKTYPDRPEIRGMIFKVKHLLNVEEIGE
jgi:large subunit ribosomal protein L30